MLLGEVFQAALDQRFLGFHLDFRQFKLVSMVIPQEDQRVHGDGCRRVGSIGRQCVVKGRLGIARFDNGQEFGGPFDQEPI